MYAGKSLLKPEVTCPTGPVLTGVAVCQGGKFLSGYSDGILKLWTPKSEGRWQEPTLLREIPASSDPVSALTLSSSGLCALTGDQAGLLKLWRVHGGPLKSVSGPHLAEPQPWRCVGIADGCQTTVLCSTTSQVFLWDIRGEIIWTPSWYW